MAAFIRYKAFPQYLGRRLFSVRRVPSDGIHAGNFEAATGPYTRASVEYSQHDGLSSSISTTPESYATSNAIPSATVRRPPITMTKNAWSDHDLLTKTNKQRDLLIAERRLGPLSANALALQSKMRSGEIDPFAFAKTYLESDKIVLETLRVLLHEAGEYMFTMPRYARKAAYEAKNYSLAKAVLQKIWQDPFIWLPLVSGDHSASWFLTWFAVMDKVDHLMADWIKVDLGHLQTSKEWTEMVGDQGSSWRGTITKNLVEVQCKTNWAHSADPAIEFLHNIFEWKKGNLKERLNGKGPSLLDVVPLAGSVNTLVMNVSTGSYHKTSVWRWAQLTAMRRTIINSRVTVWSFKGSKQLQFDMAKLDLFHPAEPSASKFLALLCEMHNPRDEDIALIIPKVRIRHAVQICMQRAWVVLKAHHQESDAEWVTEAYEATFGTGFRVENSNYLVLPAHMDQVVPPNRIIRTERTSPRTLATKTPQW